MCGIIGIVSHKEQRASIVASCLRLLEYRGYDSVGIAALDVGKVEVMKTVGGVEDLLKQVDVDSISSSVLVGHTRWATHGMPTFSNAHPHTDCSSKIAVVHNGTITNFDVLKEELTSLGHRFKSETDTEVIPHMMEEWIKKGLTSWEAFKRTVQALNGSYAILAVVSGERRIYFARKDNPLTIGLGKGSNYIASDAEAFVRFTRRVVRLMDGELGYIEADEVRIFDFTGKEIAVGERVMEIGWSPEESGIIGYEHYMLKEIQESPRAVRDTLAGIRFDQVSEAASLIRNSERVLVVGSGTSYHAGLLFGHLLEKEGYDVRTLIASEATTLRPREGDVLISISQSGETLDVLNAVKNHFKKYNIKSISLTNRIESALNFVSDIRLHTRAGPEVGVAATKTFTSQLAALLYLKSLIVGEPTDYLEGAPAAVSNSLSQQGYAKAIGEELCKKSDMFYLGRGMGVPLAMEGALKIKEVAYIHAEAYPAGESKHGPIALISDGFPVFFVNDGERTALLINNLKEMKARRAKTYSVSVNSRIGADEEIYFEGDSSLAPFYISPFLQMVAYFAAVCKGANPDRPRNLAKTVTVE
ncbi:glutamine--fructose-6-phosphate transaminase (isomerizing) [Sulfodiicoccus acidiphilus]|uniref:glutamine--fructose-6-phosphate transaminase (isomerizing) n=1 Tax=Sulfodiicoccus acidiphilus TaxID=1670455 RepID=UPI000F832D8C|nr:glutamine--fructose-6-phosphate transaminase (isomerizing) [Sulfodiicoccus acidiphilus]